MPKYILSLLGVACCFATAAAQDDDPQVQGRPLSEWIKILEDVKSPDRLAPLQAISQLKAKGSPAVPALIKFLGEKDQPSNLRAIAANTLGQIGPAAAPAIPALIDCFADANAFNAASYAL